MIKRITTIALTAAMAVFLVSSVLYAQDKKYNRPLKGFDLSVKGGYFNYQEPDTSITYSGIVSGIQGTYKKDFASCAIKIRSEFMRGNLDYQGHLNVHRTNHSTAEYSSTNSNSVNYGASLWYTDSTLLMGRSFLKNGFFITPYTGIGYRYLNNPENSDETSDYRREVTYIYLPLVLEFQKDFSPAGAWGFIGEIDILLRGSAKAHLSDASDQYNDLQFKQTRGGGIKLAGFYNRKVFGMALSVKPFIDMWFMDNSDTDVLEYQGERVLVQSADGDYEDYCEPANMTFTGGLQLALNF